MAAANLTISNTDGTTTDTTVTITGGVTWDAGGSVQVNVTNGESASSYCTEGNNYDYTTTTWSCANVPLSLGANQITAVATENGSSISSNTITITRELPPEGPLPAPSLFTGEGGEVRVASEYVVVTGTGEPSDGETVTVTVTISGTDGTVIEPRICTTQTDPPGQGEGNTGGSWQCAFAGTLDPAGTYRVSATQSAGGPASPADEADLVVTAGDAGRGAISCSFTGAGITVIKSSGEDSVGLYRVDPAGSDSDYTPKNLGLCSGQSGSPSPGTFNDVPRGSCSVEDEGADPVLRPSGTTECVATGLTPGMWNLFYSTGGELGWDWFFVVPQTPTITGSPGIGVAQLSGAGTPGNTITVYDAAGSVCTASVGATGAWACTTPPRTGSASYFAVETDAASGGLSAASKSTDAITVLVARPARPAATPTVIPAAPDAPPAPTTLTWTLTITGVDGPLRPGQTVGLSSSGLPAGTLIDAELHSTPVQLGSTTVGADGTFDFTVRIPMDVEPGEHEIIVIATPPGYLPSPVQNAVLIQLDDEPKAVADTIPHDDPRVLAAGSGGENPRNDPNAPTAITRAIPTFFEILTSPATVGIAAGLALVILLLVALPAEVLNATIESNTSRFGRGFAAIQNAIDRATAWLTQLTRTPVVPSLLLIVTTSIIFGFVDPGFGFDLASLRLVLSLAIGLFVVTFVASRLTGIVVGRRWSLESEIGMQPAALVFAALGVILARLLDFSPGFLIGLVIGLELAHRATDLQRVKAIVIEFSFIVGLGVLAWLIYSASVALQGDSDIGFFGGLAQDALVAITSEGLTAVMVAMIPIAFLDGKKIFDASKKLWVLMFLVVATAFSLLVLPTALAGQEIGNIVWWIAVLIGFAAVTFAVTFWLRATGRSASVSATQKVDA